MASFNPDVQVSETQARDQTGVSRGTGTDRSFEAIFSGIGDVIGGAAKAADNAITNRIEKDARYGFEALNDEVGMSTDTVPAGLTQSSEGLTKLALAHQQGKVTQEYYYQRLSSTLKGLRTKYPGYEKEVDNIVQNVTGTRPANAFRDALFANIEAQQRAAATSAGKWDSWAAQKENSEVLGVLYPDFFTNPEKYSSDESKNQIRANVSQYQGRIRLAEDTVKLQSSDKAVARPQVGRLFSTISNGYIVGGSEAAGIDSPNVQNMLQTALSDGTIDQNEKESILGLLSQVKAKAQVDMRNRVASSDWGSNFSSQEINEEITNALAPINEMEQLVTSDNVSAAVRIAERNKAVTDQATADLYQKFPELGPASAIRGISQVAADTIVNDLIEKSGTGVDFVNKILGKDLIGGIAGGQVSLSQVTNRVADAAGKTSKEKQQILTQVLDGTTSILAAPDASAEVKLNTVRSVYSDKLDETWAAVDDSTGGATGTSQRFRLYNKMFNPEITKQVTALNDPEALRMYTAAAVDKFQQIPEFRRAASTLNQDLPYNRYTKVEYDPERNRLKFMVNREALRNTGFFTRTGQAEDAAAIGATVDKINQALNVVVPIIEANGADETEGVTTLFRDLNLDLNGGKQTGFWGHVYNALDALASPVNTLRQSTEDFRNNVRSFEQGVGSNVRGVTSDGRPIPAEDGFTPTLTPADTSTDPDQTGEFEEIGATGGASSSAPLAQQGDLVGDVMMANYVPEQSGNAGAQAIDRVTTQSVQQISTDPQSWESVGSETLSALPQGDISFLVKDGESVKQAASGPFTGDVSNFAGKTNPLEIASSFKGLTERTDARVIANFIRKSSGISINPADTAWCAAFVNGVLGASGSKGTGRLNARSFLNWGMPVEKPTEGDVVVFQRGSSSWQGHVGFYMGTETKNGKQYIRVLGGNQSNSVKESLYPADKLLGYRRANV